MIKNRTAALLFRIFAFFVSLSGLIVGGGLIKGPKRFLFYTNQTNLLICILFFVLCVYNAKDLIKNGSKGSACYFPRLSNAAALCIAYTLVIFWCVLAPFAPSRGFNLISYGNIVVHTITPILSILNCVLFCQRGRIKKRDIVLWPLLPLTYVAVSYILSFFGIIFYSLDGTNHHYPYFFMDFGAFGIYSIVALVVISASFVFSAFLIYRTDFKLSHRSRPTK